MANHYFAFEPNGPKRLRIKTGVGTGLRFFVDETLVNDGSLHDARRGISCTLADGSVLSVTLRNRFFGVGGGWVISQNGVSLPRSADDREHQLRQVSGVYLLFAGVALLNFMSHPGVHSNIAAAVSYGAIGWLGRRGSWRAMAVGVALYAAESILWLCLRVDPWIIALRGLALTWLFNSVRTTRPRTPAPCAVHRPDA